jgi:hypothetical protein
MPRRPVHQFEVHGCTVVEVRGRKRVERFQGEDEGSANIVASALASYRSGGYQPGLTETVHRVISPAERLEQIHQACQRLIGVLPTSPIAGTPLAKALAACLRAVSSDRLEACLNTLRLTAKAAPLSFDRILIEGVADALSTDLGRRMRTWSLSTSVIAITADIIERHSTTPLRLVKGG